MDIFKVPNKGWGQLGSVSSALDQFLINSKEMKLFYFPLPVLEKNTSTLERVSKEAITEIMRESVDIATDF